MIQKSFKHRDNKHLMTGPNGNSEFCFPKTLDVSWGEAEGKIEVEGKQNSLINFPLDQSLSVYTS